MERNMIGEGVIAHFDFRVGSFNIIGFEGRPSNQTGVGYHSQTPNIDFKIVTIVCMIFINEFITFENFWCNIVGSAAHGFSFLSSVIKFSCQSKITYSNLERIGQ